MNEGALPMTFMVKGTQQHALNAKLLVLLAAEHARAYELQEQGSIEPLEVVADQSSA
jgi:hypothetical protein